MTFMPFLISSFPTSLFAKLIGRTLSSCHQSCCWIGRTQARGRSTSTPLRWLRSICPGMNFADDKSRKSFSNEKASSLSINSSSFERSSLISLPAFLISRFSNSVTVRSGHKSALDKAITQMRGNCWSGVPSSKIASLIWLKDSVKLSKRYVR